LKDLAAEIAAAMAQQNAVEMVEQRINPHRRVQDGFMEPSIQGLRGPRTRRLKVFCESRPDRASPVIQ
jgi:hypothetical protein